LVAINVRFRRKLATAEREIQAGPAAVESAGAGLVPLSSDLCKNAINVLSVSFDPLSFFDRSRAPGNETVSFRTTIPY
jgi:hypothetical protein